MINASALAGAAAPFQGAAAARSTADQAQLASTGARSGAARTTAAKTSASKNAAARTGSAGASAPTSSAAKTIAAAKTSTTAQASAAAKTSTTSKTGTTSKTSTTGKTSTTSKTGYATIKLPADFAFLNDPKISIEEKLSRFIGLMMTRSEQRLQAQMEKMAAGATGAADGTSSSSKSSSSASGSSSKSGFSLWSLAKALVPPLGMASALLGDSTVKAVVGEVTGPVLAAAAAALGLPALAPVALTIGPEVAKLLTSDARVDVPWLDQGSGAEKSAAASTRPGAPTPRPAVPSADAADPTTEAPDGAAGSTTDAPEAKTSSTPKSSGSSSGGASTTVKVPATEGSTSEKAQLLELQRLQDQDKELFSLFSNMLRAMHDARMTAIQNIR